MKGSRNPIARNAHKVNLAKIIPPKKGKGSKYKRQKSETISKLHT